MSHAVSLNHPSRCLRRTGLLFAGLLLLGLACIPQTARAVCWFTFGSATTVTYNVGTTITLTPDTPVGKVLWTSSTATPANPPVLDCDGNTNSGIVNTIASSTPVNGDNTLIPTGIPGISYRLLHPDSGTKLALYPNYPQGFGSATYSVTTNLQLVYTGPYLPPNNSTLIGQLAQWKVDICNGTWTWNWDTWSYYCSGGTVAPRPVEIFNINATIRILVPTCNIAADSKDKTVTLPPVLASQFTGTHSTAGDKHFTLNLTDCPDNLKVSMTLDANHPWPGGADGVIAPASGANQAHGVGVQLLHDDDATPVDFGHAFLTGTTSGNHSSYAIDLYARYYQTAATITGGEVNTTATYTLTYQ